MYYTVSDSPVILNINKSAVELVKLNKDQEWQLLADTIDSRAHHIDEYSESGPQRNFIVLDFTSDNPQEVEDYIKNALDNPAHILYRTDDKKYRLVINLVNTLNEKTYKETVKNISLQLRVIVKQACYRIKKPIVFKKIESDAVIEYNLGQPLELATQKHTQNELAPNSDRLIKATDEFLKTEQAKRIVHDRSEVTRFFDTIAKNYLDGMLDDAYLTHLIKALVKMTGYKEAQWQTILHERLDLLKRQADLRETVRPFSDYVQLYTQAKNAKNIAQQLVANLPEGVTPDPDYTLAEASDFIEMMYAPYLLDQHGKDDDNLVIFNPATGIWTRDSDTLYSLLTAIRPYSTRQQFDTFTATFAAKARNANRFIKPYSGSRYLLFDNCMVDIKDDMKTYPLNSPVVKDLHFIDRSHIHLEFKEDPILPQLKGMRQSDNGAWNPRDFLLAYADNDSDKYKYLLFGLSLGLFGGHNFGVHFDIQGESRWGKSTLAEIYNALYDYHVNIVSFSDLNNQFPFTSYRLDTSIIWIDESNEGVPPLDDSRGTVMYDGLADNQVRFQVKGRDDIVLSNPPQVYVTGTQFIKAKELYTGPAGRTLAFKLPAMTDALRKQVYSKEILNCLQNKRVLQWLVWNFIKAYKDIVPEGRMDDLKLNLANSKDLDIFPKPALDWRKEFVVGGNSVDDWFENEIEPYLSTDPKKPTYLHPRILYTLYLHSYEKNNPNDRSHKDAKHNDQLIKRLKTVWDSESDIYGVDYEVGSLEKGRKTRRKRIASPSKMNFNWSEYDEDFSRPRELDDQGYPNLELFGKRATDWIAIYKKTK